jgi:transcriptional enhancer factor
MYWPEYDDTSSAGSSTPSTTASALPSPPLNQKNWPTLQSPAANDVLQSVIKVRKTWKTLRDGQTVWPLELEAALLEGLEQYVPEDCRETRMLGRFPRRNRFISDYIFDKTGTRRSAKQVGSRLQQLRESCGGKQLMHLLSPFRKPAYAESAGSGDSPLNSPISPRPADSLFPLMTDTRPTVVYIDILPTGSPDDVPTTGRPTPSGNGDIVHASDHPRAIGSINPTVSFTSPAPLVAHSRFTVYSEDLILHAENVPLVFLPDRAPQPSDFLYSTKLVPKYWDVIVNSPDPTRFTIFHDVVKQESSRTVFSATYKFRYPPRTITEHSSSLHTHSALTTKSDLDILATDFAPFDDLLSLPDTRYPMYESAGWNTSALASSHDNENSTMHRYPRLTNSSSLFPELSDYVSHPDRRRY